MFHARSTSYNLIRPKKNICVFTVTCQKNLGSVGRDIFFFFFYIIMSPIYIRNKFCNHNIADCGNSGGNTNLNIAVYVFSTKSLNYRSGLGYTA